MAIFYGTRQRTAVTHERRLLGEPAVVPVTEPAPAASTDNKATTNPELVATMTGTVIFVIGALLAVLVFHRSGGPTFTPVAGVGAFAVFYIAAQASERLVELVLPAFEKVEFVGKEQASLDRDRKVTVAVPPERPDTAAVEAADAQARVDQLKANRVVVAFGTTAALGMLLCGYLHADFLAAVGVSFHKTVPSDLVRMLVTGLVVGGGSKQLHDLITNMSKSSDAKSTPAATGGQR